MNRQNEIVRFGAFEVDLHLGELRKNGARVKLQDQPFKLLTILLERPGEVVTREELHSRLWPDGTFVDFDHSLNASVNKLREAIGDADSNSRLIETIPRRGYRFAAPAELPQPQPSQLHAKRAGAKLIPVAATALVILAAGGAWFLRKAPPAPAAAIPLTSTPGLELQPTFSPDGNYIAYSGGPGGGHGSDIFVKQIGADSLRRLTAHPAPEVSPKWSPDGRNIAFVRIEGESDLVEAAVLVMPALGGPERKVGTIWVTPSSINNGAWLIDWFPDSETLLVADKNRNDTPFSLFALNTRTAERWRLTTPPATVAGVSVTGDLDPAVSPDGRKLAFTRGHPIAAEIHLLDLNPEFRAIGEPRSLTSGNPSCGPVWTPDSQELLFAVGPQHRKRLNRLRVSDGSQLQPVPYGQDGIVFAAALSSRWQLAYPVFRADVGIYRTELSSGGGGIRTNEFLPSTFVDHQPEYSPDGGRIAFSSNRTGSQQIWLADADGLNVHQLTSLPANQEATAPRWSPDGTRIAFVVALGDSYVIDAAGGPPSLWMKNVRTPEWSRDGKWIYFASLETGRQEVWKAEAEGGRRKAQVTRGGGATPRFSSDGKYLYFVKKNVPAELWRMPIDGGEETRIIDRIANDSTFVLSGDDIYFIPRRTAGADPSLLMILNTKSSSQRMLRQLSGHPFWGLSISPDRRYILSVHLRGENEGDLMYVERFH